MYKFLKNVIIKEDYQFPPELCTLMNITKCAVLNNYLYFRGAFWIINFEPLQIIKLYKIHNSLTTGHLGKENTFTLFTRDFYYSRYL